MTPDQISKLITEDADIMEGVSSLTREILRQLNQLDVYSDVPITRYRQHVHRAKLWHSDEEPELSRHLDKYAIRLYNYDPPDAIMFDLTTGLERQVSGSDFTDLAIKLAEMLTQLSESKEVLADQISKLITEDPDVIQEDASSLTRDAVRMLGQLPAGEPVRIDGEWGLRARCPELLRYLRERPIVLHLYRSDHVDDREWNIGVYVKGGDLIDIIREDDLITAAMKTAEALIGEFGIL
jgi:hypothetical protein